MAFWVAINDTAPDLISFNYNTFKGEKAGTMLQDLASLSKERVTWIPDLLLNKPGQMARIPISSVSLGRELSLTQPRRKHVFVLCMISICIYGIQQIM